MEVLAGLCQENFDEIIFLHVCVCFVFQSDAAACENLTLATKVKMAEFASIQTREEEKMFYFEAVDSSQNTRA